MFYILDEAYALRPGGILVEGNLQTIWFSARIYATSTTHFPKCLSFRGQNSSLLTCCTRGSQYFDLSPIQAVVYHVG